MTTSEQLPIDRIRFVLVETTHTGNIGAVARAMKTMGLRHLHLVRPSRTPDAEAIARASGADDLLAAAPVHQDLLAAIADCRLVLGSSARARTIAWPELDPTEAARLMFTEAGHGHVALLLGRESSGLTNDELAQCHYLVHIPTDPGFSSLNVAAAAQIFAYELRRVWRDAGNPPPIDTRDLATADAMEGFFTHLSQTLVAIGYADPRQSDKLSRRLRRLFFRARPDCTELNILRGILNAAQGRKSPDRFVRPSVTNGRTSTGEGSHDLD